jgi:hypothetical protein
MMHEEELEKLGIALVEVERWRRTAKQEPGRR